MTSEITVKERILGGLWGAVVGDALGVPVEFKGRDERKKDPVTGMRGYGTFNLPPGSWSDDSSLMLCTVESLLDGFDTNRMGQLFIRWLNEAYWTPWGEVFDVGGATRAGIRRMERGITSEAAGGNSDRDNGNGSIMRILPIGLYFADSPPSDIIAYAHRASSLTHRHPRSQMACGLYCLMAASLLKGVSPGEAYIYANREAQEQYNKPPYAPELPHFSRLLSGSIADFAEDQIHSSGYVIHTLEASLWCLLTTRSYEEAVLKAVNLGEDTDTTAIVTGGLSGLYYGLQSIPVEWANAIARKEDIGRLFEEFCSAIDKYHQTLLFP